MSLVLLFAIAIFQKIFNEESKAIITDEGPRMQSLVKPIFLSDLQKNFILDQTSEELLPITPPFFLKIKTLDQNRYFEKKISYIRPDFFKKVRGNHHLSSVDQLTAFDFK